MSKTSTGSRLIGKLLPGALVLSMGCGHSAPTKPPAVARPVAPPLGAFRTPAPGTDRLAHWPKDTVQVILVRLSAVPRFEVPQVRLSNAAVARRINATLLHLLLTANLEDTTRAVSVRQAIRRAVAEYNANSRIGMFSTGYEVLLNRAGLLSLALVHEYMGAYPSTATSHVTFDVHTGRQLALPDLLSDTLALRQQWHQRIEARLRAYRLEVTQDATYDSTDWETVCEYTGWNDTTQHLRPAALPCLGEFALTPKGLVLYTSFSFPHVVLNLAPEDDYLFAYSTLAPWIMPSSRLSELKKLK